MIAPAEPAAGPARAVPVALALTLGLAVIYLAWPRLQASVAWLPIDTALTRHWSGETLAPDPLAALSERARDVIGQHEHHRYYDGLSVLEYLQSQQPGLDAATRRAHVTASGQAALASVNRAPMKPAGWLRLAVARQYAGEPPASILGPLFMSVYTGRVEPTLQLLRLSLLYDLQRSLEEEGQGLLIDQTLLAWRLQPRELVAQVRDGRIPYDRLAAALAGSHPEVLDAIDEVIRGTVR